MFARMARSVPASGTGEGSSAGTCAVSFSSLMSTSAGLAIDRVPFGPLTLTFSGWTFISMPFARATGFLATRDMCVTPLGHEAQDFTADALLARLRIGHDALGGGDDRDAEATEDLRDRVLAAVLAQARARDALQALDHRLAFEVLQRDLEFGLGAVLGHAEVADVALALQHLGDRDLGLGRRHFHRRLADGGRIPDADQHVGDGISHAHFLFPFLSTDIRRNSQICETIGVLRVTRTPCAGPARRRAWSLRAACCGRGRTWRRRRAGGRSARNAWSGGFPTSRAAASAA